ncbi:alpha-ketoglutarate-dependent dioxygenase AlkB family protein [Aureivirga sp. CE67]|uniref:alpha-ketoglutarate-dependent dioxygenase AlkB family protein n=1 Tax=Aureivirga sp. CE67 TaxID=1788983 RepID=UPI0018C9EA1D|nr:alpha-ketoglutarate-dependent dioxygenase AlkB [Aureivirga sp. CE67]
MKLFDEDATKNWLPEDGIVHYFGVIFNGIESDYYFKRLLEEIEWKNDEAIIFGKHIVTKRKVAWYANVPLDYTYSNLRRQALPWNELLLELKKIIEEKTEQKYNSCLLNLYHTGEEGVSWHSDDEKELKKSGSIASLSFGASRKFAFRHNETKEKIVFELHHGDLLEMKGETQDFWKHSILTTKKIKTPRISLTFRQMNI